VRRFRIVVGAASDDFKLQRVGTNPWSLGSRVRSDYFSHPISHGRGSYVTFLNCRACLRLYPFGMRRSLNKFQELPDDCTCDGEGLAPVSSVPRIGGFPEPVTYECPVCGHVETVEKHPDRQ